MPELIHVERVRRFQTALVIALVGSVAWFVEKTIHWPLTGDASLMHYVAFLMDHGRAPYREIGDMNFPLSYAPAWVVSQLFAAGDLPWRLYDLALLVVAGGAMYCIARPYGAFPAVWAGCLFAVIHGRDGLLQVGQRDLFAAVLLIVGVAFLFASIRGSRSWVALGFGVCAGAASMIKPTFAPFLLLVFVEYFARRKNDSRAGKRLLCAALGWLVPVTGCLILLAAKGSLAAFWYAVIVAEPYHARIGHAPTRFLISNSVSPIASLIVAWLIVRFALWVRRDGQQGGPADASLERHLLLLAVILGIVSYLVQQRGYPYHRYPFQVFLMIVMALDFIAALRSAGWVRWVGGSALLWGAVVLAPVSAVKAGRYEWRRQPFRSAMQADLERVAGERGVVSLDEQVQCLDSISGCIVTLDHMELVQSTGVMYDEFLFNPGGARAVDEARAGFLREVEGNPPLVFVMSESLFPAGPDSYKKLDQWTEFGDWLNAHYVMKTERKFQVAVRDTGKPVVPSGYRLYLRK